MNKTFLFAALCAATLPAHAVDGEILITQAKALAGNVTPGDAPGFPVTLSQPGKYKLASSLSVPDGVNGLYVTARNVTLDLNGFTIEGPVVCSGMASTLSCGAATLTATAIYSNANGLKVRDGTIQGFGWGVYDAAGKSVLVEDLYLSDIADTAIRIGQGSIARGNRLSQVIRGIQSYGLITGNSVHNARTSGIVAGFGNLVLGNQVQQTGQSGIIAEDAIGPAAVAHSAASLNASSTPISGGESLGGGADNFCAGNLC